MWLQIDAQISPNFLIKSIFQIQTPLMQFVPNMCLKYLIKLNEAIFDIADLRQTLEASSNH